MVTLTTFFTWLWLTWGTFDKEMPQFKQSKKIQCFSLGIKLNVFCTGCVSLTLWAPSLLLFTGTFLWILVHCLHHCISIPALAEIRIASSACSFISIFISYCLGQCILIYPGSRCSLLFIAPLKNVFVKNLFLYSIIQLMITVNLYMRSLICNIMFYAQLMHLQCAKSAPLSFCHKYLVKMSAPNVLLMSFWIMKAWVLTNSASDLDLWPVTTPQMSAINFGVSTFFLPPSISRSALCVGSKHLLGTGSVPGVPFSVTLPCPYQSGYC